MGGDDSGSRRRLILLWSGVGALLVVAFLAALGAVQRTYYSPSGFVSAYVDAVADRDVPAALAMPGAAPTKAALTRARLPEDASRELLRADVLPRLTETAVVSDKTLTSGEHRVTVRAKADGRAVTAVYTVRQTGSVLGILPTWSFATTPIGVARVTVAHAGTFTIGKHTIDPRATDPALPAEAFTVTADYLVLAPGRYELGHTSEYLDAVPAVVVANPGRTVEATVDAQPTPAFTHAVQEELNGFLDGCAQQQVLQPAGCPFGVTIDDRVQGTPTWSISSYPAVRVEAGLSSWTMDETVGVAHLSVTVQSLFDGSVDKRETDERFAVSLTRITIKPDGSLDIVVDQ